MATCRKIFVVTIMTTNREQPQLLWLQWRGEH